MAEASDIIIEIEQKRKEAMERIEQQLKVAEELYSTLLTRLNDYSEADRKKAQQVYEKMLHIVNNAEKYTAGMLEALNSAMGNVLSSTQRQRELLQEIGKTKSKLEEINTLMSDSGDDEGGSGEFNMNDLLEK